MTKWQDVDLRIGVDAVLRGQGADPVLIRKRSPRLAAIAQTAIDKSLHLIKPKVIKRRFEVIRLAHNSLEFDGGKYISGSQIIDHLAGASEVVIVVCTIGEEINIYASQVMNEDIVQGLAIDGVGSAAVEALGNAVCREIELEAASRGLSTTTPLSPGMIGWGIAEGQPIIFDLLEPSQQDIELTPSCLMVPRKSLSMIIGIGPDFRSDKKICDYCSMRNTCVYQELDDIRYA